MTKKHVLVVEDDVKLRTSLAEKLNLEGFIVSFAVKGNEAIAKINEGRPDLVLLDIILPNMSGWEVLKEIKSSDEINKTPVVIISNFGTEASVNQAKEAGAIDFIIKSNISLEDLVSKIKSLIN